MENKKILAGLVLAAIAASSISYSFADDTNTSTGNNFFGQRKVLTDDQKTELAEIKILVEKKKSGEDLTDAEQTTLDTFKENHPKAKRGGKGGMKGGMKGNGFQSNLTDEEKEALESMTDDERKEFIDEKREEQKAKREAHENVIDKLLAGENLTDAEEEVRSDIISQRAEMKAEREVRETERVEMESIFEKLKNSEDLTDAEQAKLDAFKEARKGAKNGKGGKGGMRGNHR